MFPCRRKSFSFRIWTLGRGSRVQASYRTFSTWCRTEPSGEVHGDIVAFMRRDDDEWPDHDPKLTEI